MAKDKIDQALEDLASAIKSQPKGILDISSTDLIKKIPLRALSGDHIDGGKILRFSSSGIQDNARSCQIEITDQLVSIRNLSVGALTGKILVEDTIEAKTVIADVIKAKEIKADINFEKDVSVVFGGDKVYGKGLLWKGIGYTRQLVFQGNPDRIFCSENIELAKDKSISINGSIVLDNESLGPTVVKSNLREIGRLKKLTVDGSVTFNDYMFFNGALDRLGLGTDQPNAALSVAEMGIEVMLGTENNRGILGTFASHAVDIVTDNTARISISANGNIELGNRNRPPVNVSIHGTVGINVSTPDSRVKLDVGGAVRINGSLHLKDLEPPKGGVFNQGDIVWNANPQQKRHIGWVCISSGSPGIWAPFGEIK